MDISVAFLKGNVKLPLFVSSFPKRLHIPIMLFNCQYFNYCADIGCSSSASLTNIMIKARKSPAHANSIASIPIQFVIIPPKAAPMAKTSMTP